MEINDEGAFKYLFPDFFIAEKVCFFGHHVLLHAVILIDADGKFGRIPLAEAGLRQRAVFFIMVPEVTESLSGNVPGTHHLERLVGRRR